jgi:hypothetical protein
MSEPEDFSEQGLLRDATRARRLAGLTAAYEDRRKLIEYAEDKERRAAALRGRTGTEAPPLTPVVQVQVQVQQQQETGPPVKPKLKG